MRGPSAKKSPALAARAKSDARAMRGPSDGSRAAAPQRHVVPQPQSQVRQCCRARQRAAGSAGQALGQVGSVDVRVGGVIECQAKSCECSWDLHSWPRRAAALSLVSRGSVVGSHWLDLSGRPREIPGGPHYIQSGPSREGLPRGLADIGRPRPPSAKGVRTAVGEARARNEMR